MSGRRRASVAGRPTGTPGGVSGSVAAGDRSAGHAAGRFAREHRERVERLRNLLVILRQQSFGLRALRLRAFDVELALQPVFRGVLREFNDFALLVDQRHGGGAQHLCAA
jgi:hypothetical protein